MDASPAAKTEDLWVFAYGSLMWRPGFSYLERVSARLYGAHRARCAVEPRRHALEVRKPRSPHQRAVGEHPKVFGFGGGRSVHRRAGGIRSGSSANPA